MCCESCPDVFEMGPEGAEVLSDPVPLDLMELVSEAEENCPTGAISSS
jgi:ferredoxin